ncbi:Receptor-type tyrosine- phosphatase delta, partial [Paramuricea clavata]
IVLLPINLTIINIKSRSAEISWPDPKDYERFGVSRFWIKLKKENSLILNITTGKVNKYEINNLTPYTTYEISVAPGNDYGFSKESITSFLTSEEAPSGPPLNIRTTSRSASSLSFAWDPPDTTKQNGVIISYTVCISHSENGACFQTFNTGVRKWLVINLNPLSKYYVRVLASTKVGHGNYSESKGLFTSGNLVLLPVNLTVTNIKSRSAEISWQDPKDHERFGVSRFWVILKKENSLILNITTGKVNKFEINNLTPDTTYEISVAAETDYYGFGEESITSFLTSEEAPSGPPLNIRTTSRSASSLSFAWDPPDTTKQNGVITSYTVCVSHSENGPCFQTFVTCERKWLVINLNPLTKYYVRVLASTKVGHGNYSESREFFTSGILLPIHFTVTNIKSRSAEISWPDLKDHERFGVSRFWIKVKKENSPILNIFTGKVNKYKINNLTPYTTYEISVAAGNDYGFGEESNTSFSTSEEAPSGPPLNIRTTSRSASSLSFAWDPPHTTKQNGIIISYTACVSHSENEPCFLTFITSKRRWLVVNLSPLTKYFVRVLASTKVGHGNYSESKGFFTSGRPAEKAIAETSSTLTFSLKIPSETFVYFYVVASKLKDGKEPASSDSYENSELVTYAEAGKSTNPKPYIAAVVTSSGVDGNMFILGDGRNTDNPTTRKQRSTTSDYFNGPLQPGTSYSVFQRIIINEMGDYYSTDWSPPSKTSEGTGLFLPYNFNLISIIGLDK